MNRGPYYLIFKIYIEGKKEVSTYARSRKTPKNR